MAFLGLGVMGYPMAGHLAAAGHQVTVYNRTPAKAEAWTEEFPGGSHATMPREAVKGARMVFSCVGNDDDLRSIVLGDDGAFAGMEPGAVFVDHTTASAQVARELYAEARKRGLHFIDAPVSGGQAGAVNGQLTVMCGGDQDVFDQVAPVADAFSRAFTYMGACGNGQLTKMVNQICIAGLVQGLSEAIAFGLRAELDVEKVLDVIGKGAARAGRWTIAARPWPWASSTSALPWTGCARTWAWCSTRPSAMARACRSRRWWTSSMATCSRWAAAAGTRPASSSV
ncbi:2-hydroxy-3-oxopropionate reductase [bioreactor metagenome]|uniref:2-hydroxy-3-oxopropionate reductase n=1 Tax=bioreactor metagenome TaxID=1076179 RepID=A0A645E1R5_9ZZZZ